MGRKLVLVVDARRFRLDDRVVEANSLLELQLEGDRWLGGTVTPAHDGKIVFALRLGGPMSGMAPLGRKCTFAWTPAKRTFAGSQRREASRVQTSFSLVSP